MTILLAFVIINDCVDCFVRLIAAHHNQEVSMFLSGCIYWVYLFAAYFQGFFESFHAALSTLLTEISHPDGGKRDSPDLDLHHNKSQCDYV
ncbi:hypothetical protein [Aeromonas veronii]|uniref:hypothetical protein n=1 Tax=Aeromonas veronii TaxID=654 RepID=UPI00406C7886